MKFSVDAISVKGPVREKNEDMLSIAGRMVRDAKFHVENEEAEEYWYTFVADGVGGQEKGEVASAMLLDYLRDCFTMGDIEEYDVEGDLKNHVQYIGSKINAISSYLELERPMGTTVCGMAWIYDGYYMLHCGDSKLYHYHDGELVQISTDDVNEEGYLTDCVGAMIECEPLVLDISIAINDDDKIIICSDGIGGYVSDDELCYFLETYEKPAEAICERAFENGNRDNASIAVISIGGGSVGFGDGPDDDGRWDAYA